jgi:GTP-binding protein
MFVDRADILVVAGDGGKGSSSFRREKFVPQGGPDGGDGGRGGSIILRASSHHNTLVTYKFHPEFRAKRGAHGEGSNRSGRTGADLILDVPVGTIVYEKTDAGLVQLADLTEVGQDVVAARGGHGGRGNQHFATATNRAPRRTEPAQPGELRQLTLSLKLLADVGLVGFPNVGKSTLVSRLSSAKPKIANYPFTTLTPHLGVVMLSDERSFVLADVPGLLEGAHDGHGLGDRFLSHLERTKVLVHMIDVSSESGRDPIDDFEVICRELASYAVASVDSTGVALAEKPRMVAANKIDALDNPEHLRQLREHLAALGVPLFEISAVTGDGLGALREAMWQAVCASQPIPVHTAGETTHVTALSRTGILGGTFDPIHLGHLDIAAAAQRALELTELIFVPSRTQPHRQTAPIASEDHRLAMVTLAVSDQAAYRVSDQELRTNGPSYTSATLETYARTGTPRSQLFFITGADAFAEISSWHDYPNLLSLSHFVVVSRLTHVTSDLRERLPDLAHRMRDASTFVDSDLTHDETWIWLVDATTRDISSSDIRTRLAQGDPIDQHVPLSVAAYIERSRTYSPGAMNGSSHD